MLDDHDGDVVCRRVVTDERVEDRLDDFDRLHVGRQRGEMGRHLVEAGGERTVAPLDEAVGEEYETGTWWERRGVGGEHRPGHGERVVETHQGRVRGVELSDGAVPTD